MRHMTVAIGFAVAVLTHAAGNAADYRHMPGIDGLIGPLL
jgi:hypothetical protein